MTSNVVPIMGPAQDPDVVLEKAKGEYKSVLVIGYNHEGDVEARGSMDITHEKALWLMECFKNGILQGKYHHRE